MTKVTLIYFRDTGKYYGAGAYQTHYTNMYDVRDEVWAKRDNGLLPGTFGKDYHIYIEVEADWAYPYMIPINMEPIRSRPPYRPLGNL